jgi:hypothetical protein
MTKYKIDLEKLELIKGAKCPCLGPSVPESDTNKCPCMVFTKTGFCRCKIFEAVKQ